MVRCGSSAAHKCVNDGWHGEPREPREPRELRPQRATAAALHAAAQCDMWLCNRAQPMVGLKPVPLDTIHCNS